MAGNAPSGGCPVGHPKAEAPKCPIDHTKASGSSTDHQPSLQAFMPKDKPNALVNPSNNMPTVPEQAASSTQQQQLSTQRTVSSIPKADRYESAGPSECPALHDQAHSDKWIYPSEQMFFNAMKRKNWNPQEQDMKTVVPIHNIVNEQCWRHILEWEKLHENRCGGPKLLRFEGKAKEMTVKTRLRSLVGCQMSFDRQCLGQRVLCVGYQDMLVA
ncbi:Cytochrome c1 heme lyase [Coemansia sp. RSA 1250]|nr:Cytochrome c1 heme lyase [Coemansia sp. RSA 1250]